MPFANINFSELIKPPLSLSLVLSNFLFHFLSQSLSHSLSHSFSTSHLLSLSLSRFIRGEASFGKAECNAVLLYLPPGTYWPSCCWRPAWTRERNWRSRGYRGPRGIRPASASRLLVLRNVLQFHDLPPIGDTLSLSLSLSISLARAIYLSLALFPISFSRHSPVTRCSSSLSDSQHLAA